jgi:hypothetical protein
MSMEWESVVQIIESRRNSRSPLIDMMLAVRERYGADYVIPDPTGRTDDPSPVLTPALIAQAVDQPALRAASVLPGVYVPALKPHIEASVNQALRRRGATLATWHDSRLPLSLRRGFRHLRAYTTCCFTVEADMKIKMPRIKVRDPLTAFPEDRPPEDLDLPQNIGFVYGKSSDWLRKYFPMSRLENGGCVPAPENTAIDELWDVLEWIDEQEVIVGILGPRIENRTFRDREMPSIHGDMELHRFPQMAGCCPAVMPTTVTLDAIASQVAKIIGHVDLQGQILGLEIAAVQKSIWPDRFIIGKDANPPAIVSGGGQWQEGQTGAMNVLENVTQVGELRGSPDQSAARIQETLERNARVSSGLIPAMGGEVSGSSRTGRGLDALVGVAVDPGIQEIQEIMAYALESVNEAVLRSYCGYWPSRKYHLFNGIGGSGSFVEFTPSKDIEEDCHSKVSYAVVGADRQGTTITLGQLVGAKLMSHHTAREKHPDIDDAEVEARRILEEDTTEAMKVMLLQKAATGGPDGIVLEDMAKIRGLLRQGKELDEAILVVNQERSEKQAAVAQQPELMATPEMQPGMAGPDQGTGPPTLDPNAQHSPEAPGMGIEGPTNDQDRLRQLANALRAPQGLGG